MEDGGESREGEGGREGGRGMSGRGRGEWEANRESLEGEKGGGTLRADPLPV